MPGDDRLEGKKKPKSKAQPKAGARGKTLPKAADKPRAVGKKAVIPTSQNGYVPRLKVRYRERVVPAMMQEFGYSNNMEVPRIDKIVVNIGLGEALQNAKAVETATRDLESITGQHPITTKSKKSVAAFKVRQGMTVGLKVTLRGNRMYEFLDRLVNATLPRIRDFRGVPIDAFDGRGNYHLGLREQIMFPEIDYAEVDRLRGLEISIVTSAKSDEEARRLLTLFGMPFQGTGVLR